MPGLGSVLARARVIVIVVVITWVKIFRFLIKLVIRLMASCVSHYLNSQQKCKERVLFFYPNFTDENTEVSGGKVAFPELHNQEGGVLPLESSRVMQAHTRSHLMNQEATGLIFFNKNTPEFVYLNGLPGERLHLITSSPHLVHSMVFFFSFLFSFLASPHMA